MKVYNKGDSRNLAIVTVGEITVLLQGPASLLSVYVFVLSLLRKFKGSLM